MNVAYWLLFYYLFILNTHTVHTHSTRPGSGVQSQMVIDGQDRV